MHGGSTYVFGRLRKGGDTRTGVYFQARITRRLGAFSYDSDQFGEGKRETRSERRQNTIKGMRQSIHGDSNEINFRDQQSLFEDLDRIVFTSKAETDRAIADMKAMAYKTWSNGRKVEEVLLTKQRSRRPKDH